MKTSISLLFFMGISLASFSQEIKEISIINGHIVGNLPYGQPFILKGQFPNERDSVSVVFNNGTYYANKIEGNPNYQIYVSNVLKINSSNPVKISYFTKGRTGIIEGHSTVLDSETDTIDAPNTAVRYAPIAGVGVAFLGTTPKSEVDMFTHVGFKFYLNKTVDRRNKNNPKIEVYERFRDHFGILLAGGISNLAYRGKALDKPVLNFYPMLGLSYDFLPELSLDAGTIFFDYNKVDSSIQSSLDAKLKMGFFMTVSLDFDLFTRFKDLAQNNTYNQ